MKKAKRSDLNRITEILSNAYVGNPSVERVMRAPSERNRSKLMRLLAVEMLMRDALYITSNANGVGAVYEMPEQSLGLKGFMHDLKIMIQVTGLRRGVWALKRRKTILNHRHKEKCLYFWILAVDPESSGIETIQEIRDFIFEMSSERNLPIYAETPMKRTKVLYERYGFETYNKIQFDDNYTLWLMRRHPSLQKTS